MIELHLSFFCLKIPFDKIALIDYSYEDETILCEMVAHEINYGKGEKYGDSK